MTRVKILLPEGKAASNFYRAQGPADILIADGMDIDYSTSKVDVAMRGGEIVRADVDADVVVFPRPGQAINIPIAKSLQRQGIRVVAELDDDFHAIQPGHVSWRAFQPHLNKKYNWKYTMQFCNIADMVVGTTPAILERYAKHGRGVVIENFIPKAWLDIVNESDNIIGWAGNTHMHPDDLSDTAGAVWDIMKKHNIPFRHLGKGSVARDLGITNRDRIEEIDWVDYEQYPHEVSKFRVGIAPLQDNQFNQAKSWLKALEYAALGVPYVASNTPDYTKLHKRGAGVLAKNYRKWYAGLERLLTDESYRNEVIDAGRATASELTMEDNAWRFAEAWVGDSAN